MKTGGVSTSSGPAMRKRRREMSPIGLQTAEEAMSGAPAGVLEPEQGTDPAVAAQRTRRVLRAVEHYKAMQIARDEVPREDESWLVLLAALAAQDAADD
jgi:hypothetical protein